MSLAWSYCNDSNPSRVSASQWTHIPVPVHPTFKPVRKPWTRAVNTNKHVNVGSHSLPLSTLPNKHNRNRRPTDHGAFGFGCGVRTPGSLPPCDSGQFAEGLPAFSQKRSNSIRNLRWQREHLLLTSKYLPDRVPLPDKGKPVARRGRKATDQISDLTAGLPEED